ncbi:hypothetical protein [Kitasatospora sp. NPDC088783]|uniref:hypothetical protein n=1 Tax=Kitasatospora sp. NPDC088783 TaxID=3364077 RepID=UPI00380C950E
MLPRPPWRTASFTSPCGEGCRQIPHWVDDPLLAPVRAQHRLAMDPVPHRPGLYIALCACGDLITPAWDTSAVSEAYDQHLAVVQHELRHPAGPGGR